MWTTKSKFLLILGGGILQEQTLVECNKLGLGKIIVDGNENCYCSKSPYFDTDNFICADISKPELVLSQVRKFLKLRSIKLVGVYTQGCDCAYTVAYVASKLGLPSIGINTAYLTHNKIAMRDKLREHFIRQPFVYNDDSFISFPLVVKATDNCASRGVTIVNRRDKLPQAIDYSRHFSSDGKYIVEEFIDGKEYSVDTIVYKGKVYPAGISDRTFIEKNNYAIQDGSITPSVLPSGLQERMYEVMQDCATALGVKWGAFKGDLIVRDNRVYVLEVTTRLSGGFDSQFRKPYSFGVNLIKATIDLACGKELDFSDIVPKWNKCSATFSIFPKEGIIRSITGLEELQRLEGIKQVFLTKKIGERVQYKNCADRVVHIVACRDTYEQLQNTIKQAKQILKIITE